MESETSKRPKTESTILAEAANMLWQFEHSKEQCLNRKLAGELCIALQKLRKRADREELAQQAGGQCRIPGGMTVAYCHLHKTAWQVREGEEPAGCVGCGTATSPMWGSIQDLENRIIRCEQRQHDATAVLIADAEMNDIKLGNRISALSYRVEQLESRVKSQDSATETADGLRADIDILTQRSEAATGDIATLDGRMFSLENSLKDDLTCLSDHEQRLVVLENRTGKKLKTEAYWCEHYRAESRRLDKENDTEYLTGLADGGSPGAKLLLGLISADGGVVIWIGE